MKVWKRKIHYTHILPHFNYTTIYSMRSSWVYAGFMIKKNPLSLYYPKPSYLDIEYGFIHCPVFLQGFLKLSRYSQLFSFMIDPSSNFPVIFTTLFFHDRSIHQTFLSFSTLFFMIDPSLNFLVIFNYFLSWSILH